MPTLVNVTGLPGVGKTTHAKGLASSRALVRLCPDEWMDRLGINLWDGQARDRIEGLQRDLAANILSAGGGVVIEWGTWAEEERTELLDIARRHGATAELHYLHAPSDVLFTRIRARGMEDPPVSKDDINTWVASFQAPTEREIENWDHFISLDTSQTTTGR